jgi:hypothetical protein
LVVVVVNAKRRGRDAYSPISEHSGHTPQIVEHRRMARALTTKEYLRWLVDIAPPLTVEQKSRLAAILAPAVAEAAAERANGDAA